jgi:GNAT acetyltransferase-like protein
VAVLAEGEYTAWNKLVAESDGGGIYSTPEYLDALCGAAGGRFRILAARRGEELAGGVALYERDSAFGAYVSPRLLLYYNGLVLRRWDIKYPSERTSRQLKVLAALEEALSRAGYASVLLKSRGAVSDVRPFLEARWTARPSYSYVIPLRDLPAQWTRVEQNLRRLIDRCREQGMTLVDDDDFETFYHLHVTTLGRKDVAAYLPHDPFQTYFRRLHGQGLCRLYHARTSDGRTAASQLVLLGAHPVSHSVSAAADPEFNKMGASAFLRWRVCEALGALGFAGNDLTDAALNPVTHFKSQLGGDLELSLALQSPETARYRLGTGAVRLYRRARGAAGSLARRLLGRGAR